MFFSRIDNFLKKFLRTFLFTKSKYKTVIYMRYPLKMYRLSTKV